MVFLTKLHLMKKQQVKFALWLVAIIISFIVLPGKPAMAQTGMPDFKNSTPEQRAQFQTEMMTSKLKLDAAQQAKVQTINLKYAGKMQAVIKSDDGRFSKMKQARSLQEAKDGELKAVFNATQYKQYKDFEEEMKAKLMEKVKEKQ
jgi:hypothetical protein